MFLSNVKSISEGGRLHIGHIGEVLGMGDWRLERVKRCFLKYFLTFSDFFYLLFQLIQNYFHCLMNFCGLMDIDILRFYYGAGS